ncbi:TonB-dependent receptor [Affinibrenneria salicis]|uniref:TonB-dependent receptor n=1 Tax=Affinibrenneria salicis TaxID=2590031 RepID=A0A5J5FY23_9GAMM|nr:TonB-dependent receptor [Affinibrenneria salicis]KAA8998859.1 TonB-dependent receptor [Affinibrenneria salicis]
MKPQRNSTTPAAKLRLSSLAIAIGSLAIPALAQAEEATEHVEVIGQAASITQALNEQRTSDAIRSVVHADGVAQLPDDNAAEALQRLPGVSVERDQGEGRYISVRGLGPDLNNVQINGTTMPSPESDRRAVALDVLPSELVQSLSVVKTLTPDMDANSLGGTVEVNSLSAFDHAGLFYTLGAEGSYDSNSNKSSPKFSGAVSDIFSIGGGEDNFGVAAALSWQKRSFASDDVESGGDWDFSDGARLSGFEQRRYEIERERTGFGLNFDYKPDDLSSYYLRTLYSRFNDKENRQSSAVEFSEPLAEGMTGDAEAERGLKSREETQEVKSVVLGGERLLGPWTLSGQMAYSRSSETLPGSTYATFTGLDAFADSSFSDTVKPASQIGSGYSSAGNYRLDSMEWETQKTSDSEKNIRLDLARDYSWLDTDNQVKFGGKLSRRDKKNDQNVWKYKDLGDYGLSDGQLSLSQLSSGNAGYAFGQDGPSINTGSVNSLINALGKDGFYDQEESTINDYRMSEDIDAAYLMNTLDVDNWRFITGLRYEGTRFKADGTGLRDGVYQASSHQSSYHDWLPGLHARYRLDNNTQVRAAWTNSVVRPAFGQLTPGYTIDGDEAEFGNPALAPLKSKNFDLGIEHYMGRAGTLSGYLFYKDIRNFAYETDLAGRGAWADFSEAKTWANGGKARLYGAELAYSQKFDWLPSPWNGLLAGANLTLSHSSASIEGNGMSRKIPLPDQSDTVGNLMVGWENDAVSVRLSANYKSDYLSEVAAVDDRAHDSYVDDQVFVDLSVRYFLTKQLQLSFEAQNLTNEHFYTYTGSRGFNSQYEQYGPTFKLGVTYTNF